MLRRFRLAQRKASLQRLGFRTPSTAVLAALLLSGGAAKGQKAGALIGVEEARAEGEQDFGAIKPPRYATLWVAGDGSGKLKLMARIPELIVPRRDGFWHVGVVQICEFYEGTGDDGGNEGLRQPIWAAPVGKAAVVAARNPCTPRKPEDYAPPYGRPDEDKNKISQCGYELTDIEFLSPELVSSREYSSQLEDCEPRGGRYSVLFHVRRVGSNETLKFGELFGQPGTAAFEKALPDKAEDDNGEVCGQATTELDDQWRIGRNAGRWGPYLSQNVGYFGCSVDGPIAFRLPNALTGESPVISNWKVYKSKEHDVEDVFIAPSGDLAIVVTKAETKFYEVTAGVPGKLLLTLPRKPIVMVQWATGTHVADWTIQLQKIASEKPLAPLIQVKK